MDEGTTAYIDGLLAELARLRDIIADLPDHSDLDAAAFEVNRLRAERNDLKALTVEQGKKLVKMHSLKAENECLRAERDELAVALREYQAAHTERAKMQANGGVATNQNQMRCYAAHDGVMAARLSTPKEPTDD